MLSVPNRQNRKLDMSDSTSQKVVCILNRLLPKFYLRQEISGRKHAYIAHNTKWMIKYFNLRNEASASFLVTFRKPKDTIRVLTANANKLDFLRCAVGLDTPIRLNHLELSIWEAMWRVPSCMGRVVLGSECSVHQPTPHSPPPPPGKLHLCMPVACTSSGLFQSTPQEIVDDSGVISVLTFSSFSFVLKLFHLCNMIFWRVETSQHSTHNFYYSDEIWAWIKTINLDW